MSFYDFPESYNNWGIIFEKIKLQDVWRDIYLVGDLKSISLWTAHQGQTATFSCVFCEGHKIDDEGKKVASGPGHWVPGPLRTLDRNIQNYYAWLLDCGHEAEPTARRKLEQYKNIHNLPLALPHDNHRPLILIMGLDPLHTIKLGKNHYSGSICNDLNTIFFLS